MAEAFAGDGQRPLSFTITLPPMSSWLFRSRGGGSEQSSTAGGGPRDAKEAKVLAEKLKGYHDLSKEAKVLAEKLMGYHDLSKDALERAYTKDAGGQYTEAVRLYRMGLQILYEGLALPVQLTGLGPNHSNVAKWRTDMNSWQQSVLDRLQVLEAPTASSSAPAAPQRITSSPKRRSEPGGALARVGGPPLQRTASGPAAAAPKAPPRISTAGLSKEEARLQEIILGEVLDTKPSVRWDDVAGLGGAKQALQEMVILPALRADLFQGLRAPERGLLLYGPPGNGKTMLAKALAHEAKATFFAISASSLTSKWVGEGEKLVRVLFKLAATMQPAIIFIDEIDSILSARTSGENEASRRLKTEFLVQFDGVAAGSERIVVIGATNRPQELDDAVRRRLVKRIYIPMPSAETRRVMLQRLLKGQAAQLSSADIERIVNNTEGYSGSDLAALCREAAMAPIRELGSAISTVPADKIRKIRLGDFEGALRQIKPSVSLQQQRAFDAWTKEFGTTS